MNPVNSDSDRVVCINNALWHLFSGNSDGFIFGNKHYDWRCPEEKAALNQLFDLYKQEGGKMSYTMEDFTKDFTREHMHLLSAHDRLQGMSAKDIKAYLASIEKEPK